MSLHRVVVCCFSCCATGSTWSAEITPGDPDGASPAPSADPVQIHWVQSASRGLPSAERIRDTKVDRQTSSALPSSHSSEEWDREQRRHPL